MAVICMHACDKDFWNLKLCSLELYFFIDSDNKVICCSTLFTFAQG